MMEIVPVDKTSVLEPNLPFVLHQYTVIVQCDSVVVPVDKESEFEPEFSN